MKFWSCVVIFFATIAFFSPDKEDTLSGRITKNLTNLKIERVYASNNSSITQRSIEIKADDKYYLRKLIQFHTSMPDDCKQSKSVIMDFYKKSIDSNRVVSLKDFLDKFNEAKKYCVSIKDKSEKHYIR